MHEHSSMPSVPEDVLRHVAQFLSQADLHGMIEVNSLLLHLAMDSQYRSVSLKKLNRATLKQLQRLRDPTIAPRVRRLSVDLKQPTIAEMNFDMSRSIPLDVLLQKMAETAFVLSNVTDFVIHWPFDLELSRGYVLPFLTASWKSFNSGLRKLAVTGDLGHVWMLISTISKLPALQELQIEVMTANIRWVSSKIMVTTVAHFINEAAPTIRNLSISSNSSLALDYTPLFNSLSSIPNLERLAVQIEFSTCGFSDPRGLTRIFCDHATTLRHVSLTSDYGTWEKNKAFAEWMEENRFNKSILANLLTLEIKLPPHPHAFELAMGYIKRSADTLTSFSSLGYPLDHSQVDTLLSAFTHRRAELGLKVLHLCVAFLSPELVLTLARVLPCLHELRLSVNAIARNIDMWDSPQIVMEELADMREFEEAFRDSEIRSWKLRDITIEFGTSAGRSQRKMLMRLLAECIPSIQEFCGMDKHEIANL